MKVAANGLVRAYLAFRHRVKQDVPLLARTFVAPYWVNYHLEHHLLVFVPCWKLREAHALLVAKGYRPRMEVAPSYAAVIRRATSSPTESRSQDVGAGSRRQVPRTA